MSDGPHEVLDVRPRKAAKRFVAECRVLRDACTSELQYCNEYRVRSRGRRAPTSSAARRHLALATSWVVPCNSGTCKERQMSVSLVRESTTRPTCYQCPANQLRLGCPARGCTWFPSACWHFRSRRLTGTGRISRAARRIFAINRT